MRETDPKTILCIKGTKIPYLTLEEVFPKLRIFPDEDQHWTSGLHGTAQRIEKANVKHNTVIGEFVTNWSGYNLIIYNLPSKLGRYIPIKWPEKRLP